MAVEEGGPDRWLDVVVRDASQTARDTVLIELGAAADALPAWAPGAHVAVQCGADLVRYYSLTGPQDDPAIYRLGVKLAPDSRGGSRWMLDNALPGRRLRISPPRNHFPLEAGAPGYLLLSGGIGATPVVAMLYELQRLGIKVRWVHMCRSAADLGFRAWLRELSSFHDVQLHIDSDAGAPFDLRTELGRTPPETAVYCCGPTPLMSVVQAFGVQAGRSDRFHFEFFSPPEAVGVQAGGTGDDAEFEVIQHSTGRRIPVPPDKTMLAALRGAGLEMQSECEYGVCGWCAVPVIDGAPKHFDSYLTEAERESNKLVLPCVSRCASRTITLDI